MLIYLDEYLVIHAFMIEHVRGPVRTYFPLICEILMVLETKHEPSFSMCDLQAHDLFMFTYAIILKFWLSSAKRNFVPPTFSYMLFDAVAHRQECQYGN